MPFFTDQVVFIRPLTVLSSHVLMEYLPVLVTWFSLPYLNYV